VELRSNRAQGVILASGDSGAGYELFMQDGYLVFVYVYTRFKRYTLRSPKRIKSGRSALGLRFSKTGESSADVAMLINDARVATIQLPKMWQVFAPNSGVRCGENRHAPISREYDAPFVFDQKLDRVVVELDLQAVSG
jgi:arylsulfatase